MAKTYYAVARQKQDDGSYIERGQKVSDPSDEAVESGSVLTAQEFDAVFPNLREGDDADGGNQPMGTPSNMEQIEGTKLAADADKDKNVDTASGAGDASSQADTSKVESSDKTKTDTK
jgi:hypothetical protein